jgi:hypothetical protein
MSELRSVSTSFILMNNLVGSVNLLCDFNEVAQRGTHLFVTWVRLSCGHLLTQVHQKQKIKTLNEKQRRHEK